jgi:hypothetical protein
VLVGKAHWQPYSASGMGKSDGKLRKERKIVLLREVKRTVDLEIAVMMACCW